MNRLHHVAIIMDGNGRWGLKNKKSRNAGHREGLNIVEEIISDADHLDLKKIADEIGDVYYEDVNITGKLKRPKKASGGLAHMLGE